LAMCDTCRHEWESMQNWVRVLKTQENWVPDEEYIQRLTEFSMREKRRANLPDSTLADLGLGKLAMPSWFQWLFQFPKTSFAMVAVVVFGMFVGLTMMDRFNTLGNFDYIEGNVWAQAKRMVKIQEGGRITKGTTIQTAKEAESVVALRDGSEILVSSLSRLSLLERRKVRLMRGKAFFAVEKGQGDFLVNVPQGVVRVIGTAFSVEIVDSQCIVTVVEGVVECKGADRSIRVKPGFDGVFHRRKHPSLRKSQRVEQTRRWVSFIRDRRDKKELKTYYPSLASPEEMNNEHP
ncbi:hypothetical protein GF373_10885, partial [bacterium]|nr:hypothetical protein [bacterium]